MAEYFISYEELRDLLNGYISTKKDKTILVQYEAEILTALTSDFSQENCQAVIAETISMWKGHIAKPSEILIGRKYISVWSGMVEVLKVLIGSGLIEAIISSIVNETALTPLSYLKIGSAIAISIWEYLNAIKELDDGEFCVYKQVLEHYGTKQEFTLKQIEDLMPSLDIPNCRMNNCTWNCEYGEDITHCNIAEGNGIKKALKSLCTKKIIVESKGKDSKSYTFRIKR